MPGELRELTSQTRFTFLGSWHIFCNVASMEHFVWFSTPSRFPTLFIHRAIFLIHQLRDSILATSFIARYTARTPVAITSTAPAQCICASTKYRCFVGILYRTIANSRGAQLLDKTPLLIHTQNSRSFSSYSSSSSSSTFSFFLLLLLLLFTYPIRDFARLLLNLFSA